MLATLVALLLIVPSAGAAQSFSVSTLQFDTLVGPKGDQHCNVVGDLYRPESATRRNPAPALLMTNGFGGSKNDQRGIAEVAARRGYVVLSYSGLGFGGSGCRITLDHPNWDGKAASQLISFLGGGGEAKDGTRIGYVKRDRRAHDGKRHRFDPRVGMVGGSYGGGVQFAAASVDPRLDTIVPLITWNDLAYSLTPNNTDFTSGVSSATPGSPKWIWSTLFFAIGEARGLQFLGEDVARVGGGCPNFDPRVCPAFVQGAGLSAINSRETDFLRSASVSSYIDKIRIPTLLGQGQADTLFNLNESIATYEALRRRDVPVKLMWQSWGHSGPPAPGEYDGGDPAGTFQFEIIMRWFRHYLKDRGSAPELDFCFHRDWISYTDPKRAGRAYRCEERYPVGERRRMFLSGSDRLVGERGSASQGRSSFLAPPEVPTSFSEVSALDAALPLTLLDLPGTFASYTSPPLRDGLNIAGVPEVRLRLDSPVQDLSELVGPAGMTTLYLKLYDVAPDGGVTLPGKLVAPIRIPVTDEEIVVELPGIVHRFQPGHRIRLAIAGSDLAYRGNAAPQVVTIRSGPGAQLSLPVLPSR